MPGANGIKLHDECVFVSVTDWNTLFRIPVLKDGSPGPLGLVADNLRADDFSIRSIRSNVYFTHPANTVLKLEPDGTRITTAGPEEEVKSGKHGIDLRHIPGLLSSRS